MAARQLTTANTEPAPHNAQPSRRSGDLHEVPLHAHAELDPIDSNHFYPRRHSPMVPRDHDRSMISGAELIGRHSGFTSARQKRQTRRLGHEAHQLSAAVSH